MLHTYRGLVVGVSLAALASQSVLPAWAATQDTSQRKISQSEFNKRIWPKRDGNKDLWRGTSPSTVCQDTTFSNLANCPQLAAKKWLDLYLKDPNNSFFFVDLNSLSKEEDVLEVLKQVGKLNIPKEQIARTHIQAKEAAEREMQRRHIEKSKDQMQGRHIEKSKDPFDLLMDSFDYSKFYSEYWMKNPEILKNLITPNVPIVRIPLLTDGIAQTLAQDLPNLKLLRLKPDAKVNLTKGVDLSKLTLQVLGSPDNLNLKDLLDKTQIQRLDLVGINFNAAGAGKVGTALGELLPKFKTKVMGLGLNSFPPETIQGLAKALAGKKLEIEELNLVGALKKGDDQDMALVVIELLPHLKAVKKVDLRGNEFGKKAKAAIKQKAKDLGMEQQVKL